MKNCILIVFLIALFSCQEDDVCVDGSTPNLVVKLKNALDSSNYFIDTLLVTYKNSENQTDTLRMIETDSFQIPLRIDNGDIGFSFFSSLSNNSQDSLAMHYTPSEEFVSKACGLKKIYENVSYQWIENVEIQNFEVLQPNITNSNEVHLYLYY